MAKISLRGLNVQIWKQNELNKKSKNGQKNPHIISLWISFQDRCLRQAKNSLGWLQMSRWNFLDEKFRQRSLMLIATKFSKSFFFKLTQRYLTGQYFDIHTQILVSLRNDVLYYFMVILSGE